MATAGNNYSHSSGSEQENVLWEHGDDDSFYPVPALTLITPFRLKTSLLRALPKHQLQA